MEASSVKQAQPLSFEVPSGRLRRESDERLVALIREGQTAAFEVLVARYRAPLVAFSARMLGSTKDAEDMVQDVLSAAYQAIRADDRRIVARPWLYRLARNRCLNELRRPRARLEDSMDPLQHSEQTVAAADTVDQREELRGIVADVRKLPETQRTALLLRELDDLSYDQIANVMDASIPGVKSLLVRARMSLAEAAEARKLPCFQVRAELAQAMEAFEKPSAASRRHALTCSRCRVFKRELGRTGQALKALYPVAPLISIKALAGGNAGAAAVGGSTAVKGAGGGSALGGSAAGGAAATGGASATLAGGLLTKAGLLQAAAVAITAATVGMGANVVLQKNAPDGGEAGSGVFAGQSSEPAPGIPSGDQMDGWGHAQASASGGGSGHAVGPQASGESASNGFAAPLAPPAPVESEAPATPAEASISNTRAAARAYYSQDPAPPAGTVMPDDQSATGPYRGPKQDVENEQETAPTEETPTESGEEESPEPEVPEVGTDEEAADRGGRHGERVTEEP